MNSIINKANNFNVQTRVQATPQVPNFPDGYPSDKHFLPKPFGSVVAFYHSLGEKGKYALFVLIVLLFSQSKAQNINTPNKTGPLGTQVNTYSGNFFLPRNDIYIPARGLDMDISFAYNTFNYNQNKGYGNGWSFNYGLSYRVDASSGIVTIVQGDNREDTYTPGTGGTFTPMSGFFDKLTQYQTGKYLLQSKYGLKYYFDNSSTKRITSLQDLNGNTLTFGYTDSLITTVTNSAGQKISLNYSNGRLSSLVDAIATPSRTFAYTYDGYGNLIQVLDPLGNKNTYQYLVNGPMSGTTDKNGNTADIIYYPDFTVSELISCNGRKSFSYDTTAHITTVTDYVPTSTDQVTTYTYKSYVIQGLTRSWLTHISGNCCGFNMGFDYDNAGNLVKKTDANGNSFTYTYDANGNMLSITDPLGNKSSYTYSSNYNMVTGYTDAKGNTYTINYDNAGNPTLITEPGNIQSSVTYSAQGDVLTGTDYKGNVYHFAYDANGYPTQLTQPTNAVTTLVYDARGNLISGTDPNGNTTTYQYDVLNRVTTVKDANNNNSSVTYDANGNITAYKDPNGHSSSVSFDASNRVVATTNAAGQTSLYAYDAMNNLIKHTNPLGKTTSFAYDNLNRLSSITDALGNGYSFAYDNNGNNISKVYPNGSTINFTYDKMNRPVSGSDNIGTLGSIVYDANGNPISYTNGAGATISFTYDALNRVKNIIDPLGNSSAYTYDNNGNITVVKDRNNHTATYTYDAVDHPTSLTDNNGNVTSVAYDGAENVISATDANNNKTTYTYDALTRINGATYPNGSSIHLTYDNRYNVLSKQTADGTTITYQYDAANRLITKNLPGNVLNYTYDAKGRVTSASNTAGTLSLTYDDINRLLSETFNAHTTSYTYNLQTRTKNVLYPDGTNIAFTYDTRDRLSTIANGNTSIAAYQYNNINQLQQLTYPNGIIINRQYDQANRLTNLSAQASGLPNLAFTYDNEFNKTAITRANTTQPSQQFGYDAGNRLTSYTQGSSTSSFVYDGVGNRTTANIAGVPNTYTVNNLNQYTQLNSNSQITNFTFDGNGNLTFDGTFYKRYDADGRLLVDSNASTKLTYQYDAFGRRVQKTINGTSVNYYYSGLAQLEQRNAATDAVINETVFSSSLTPVMMGVNNNKYYYHQNDLNSVEAITNANGAVAESYRYDAFGKLSIYDSLGNPITASNLGNRFAFTGQEYDAQTANYHFLFRNYSPVTGMFNQRDPIGYSNSMGLYQYVNNNPANLYDPLGLCPPNDNYNHAPPPGFTDPGSPTFDAFLSTNSDLSGYSNLLGLAPSLNPIYGVVLLPTNAIDAVNSTKSLANNWDNNTGLQNFSGVRDVSISTAGVGATTFVVGETGVALATAETGTVLTEGGAAFIAAGGAPIVVAIGGVAATNYIAGKATDQYIKDKDVLIDAESEAQARQDIVNGLGQKRTKEWDRIRDRINAGLPPRAPIPQPNPNGPCPPNNNNHGNQNPNPPGPPNPGTPFSTNNINSLDPNEIIGPTGVGTPQFVNAVDQMAYTINFENSANASAPAKTVRINYPIDPKQDMNNISLGSFGFNSLAFNVPANTASYYQRLDARDSLGLYVDITAGLDVNNHQIFWVFQSIDPVTLLTPSDPLKGFLLLTDTSKPTSGHGFVNFFIKPLSSDITGDTTHAAASIVFDGNDTVPTNVAKNTIDAGAPTSHMNTLPTNSTSTSVPLSWTAADDANGSGVKSYSLYVSVNNGAFGLYATNISRKDTTFTGAGGNSYSFFVLGTDSVGNTETLKPGAEATTYINSMVLPVTWLYFTAVSQGKDGYLTWATATETNTKSFEVERSTDGRNFSTIGTVAAAGNSTVQSNYTYTDKNVVSLNIPVVYYRLKQIDKDGKTTYSNIVAVQLPVINVGPIVQAYPNPFKQTLNILIANMTALDLSDNIAIYTLEGKIVYEKPIGQRLLNTTITLTDLPQLTPGMYILKLGLNKQSYSFKLMKQ